MAATTTTETATTAFILGSRLGSLCADTCRTDGAATPATAKASAIAEATPGTQSNAEYREYKKSLDKELRQLERKLADLDKSIAEHNAKIAEINATMATSNPTAAAQLVKDLNTCYAELHKAEEDWMWAAERKQRIDKELAELAPTPSKT